MNEDNFRHNDIFGSTYFYLHKDKGVVYLKHHIDAFNIIDRKATDQDKQQFSKEWSKYEMSMTNSSCGYGSGKKRRKGSKGK